jgi:hypothetical protein
MEEQYIVPEDINEEGPDGRATLVAAKGTAISLDEAKAKGFIKEPKGAKPSEKKEK